MRAWAAWIFFERSKPFLCCSSVSPVASLVSVCASGSKASHASGSRPRRSQSRVFNAVELTIQKYTADYYDETEWYENNEDRLMCDVLDGYNDELYLMKKQIVKEYQDMLQAQADQAAAAGWDNEQLKEMFYHDSWWFEETFMNDFKNMYHQRRNAIEDKIMTPLIAEVNAAFSKEQEHSITLLN